MLENPTTNNNYPKSVSTTMLSFWDETGLQLKVSGMDNGLMFALWVPQFDQNSNRKYPPESRYAMMVNYKNCVILEEIIRDCIMPAYENGENISKGFFTNNARTSMLEFEVRDGNFYLVMHRNCDPTTRIPQTSLTFKFDTSLMVDSYDRVTGEIKMVEVQVDFFLLYKALTGYLRLAGGTVAAHGNRVVSNNRNQMFMDYIRAIANAVHAQLPPPQYTRGGQYVQQTMGVQYSYNAENPHAQNNLPPVPQTIEVDSLTDLIS